jgi:hypothetical protein
MRKKSGGLMTDVSVMLEQLKDNGYRATTFAPVPLVAEAATRDDAIGKLQQMLCQKLSDLELVQLQIPQPSQPDLWWEFAGIWQNLPEAAELEQNIREYRSHVNADPDRL